MARNRSHNLSSPSFFEPLEARQLLSHTVSTTRLVFNSSPQGQSLGASLSFPVSAKLTANGLPLRDATILFVEDNATVIGQGTTGRSGYVSGTVPTFFTGKHTITAYFEGATRYAKSQSRSYAATITAPSVSLTTTSDGLQEGTITPGSGATVTDGESVDVDYIGYLTNGTIFDSSEQIGRTPLAVTLDTNPLQVIEGFNEGIKGMQVGETRVLIIPPAIGYGAQANGSIPANSTLIFLVKLDSITG